MHITGTQINKVFELHLHKTHVSNIAPQGGIQGLDRLTLSSKATELQAVRCHMAQLPDIRRDKVSAVKNSIENGSYEVSDLDLASIILDGRKVG